MSIETREGLTILIFSLKNFLILWKESNLPSSFQPVFFLLNLKLWYIVDVNECTEGSHNCDTVNGACTNTEGNFTCACNDGFSGDGTTDGTGCTGK